MRNAFVALDMLFIAPDGRIAGIAADTTPMSDADIASGLAVRAAALAILVGPAPCRSTPLGVCHSGGLAGRSAAW